MTQNNLRNAVVFMVMAGLGQLFIGTPKAAAQVTFGSITGTLRAVISSQELGIGGPIGLPEMHCDTERNLAGPGVHTIACSGGGADVDFSVNVSTGLAFGGGGGSVFMNGGGLIQLPNPSPTLSVDGFAGYDITVQVTVSVPVTASVGLGGGFDCGITNAAETIFIPRGGSEVIPPGSYLVHGTGAIQNGTHGGALNFADFSATFSVVGFDPPEQFTWAGESGGLYSERTNWDPEQSAPPTNNGSSGDTATFGSIFDAQFNEITSYAVDAGSATAARFIVDGISLNLIGSAQVIEPSSFSPSLTLINGGRLLLENGARFSGIHGSIGFSPRLQGALAGLEINGTPSECTFSDRLIVGEFSDGELFLAGGAKLKCGPAIVGDTAIGSVNISGNLTQWNADTLTIGATSAVGEVQVLEDGHVDVIGPLVVGEFSHGRMDLVDGGKVRVGSAVIGANIGGVGTLLLTGDEGAQNSSLEVSGALHVGITGRGSLDIREGSSVQANELHFASAGPGRSEVLVSGVDIDGIASEITVFKDTQLGQGELGVLDGGHANFLNLTLGADGFTDVKVSGSDPDDPTHPATLRTSRLNVGFDDSADLTVEAGGHVICTELAVNSLATGGTGRIVVTEGSLKVNGTMRVSGDFQIGDNVVIEKDGAMFADALRLGDEATSDTARIVVRNGTPGSGSLFLITNGSSNRECSIGKDGPGVVRLENHASAGATGNVRVGNAPAGGEGLVDIGVDCSFLANDLDVGGASPGTINLLTSSSALNITGIAVVNAGGRIEGIGTINGVLVRNPGGFVSPGLSPGTLTINGDYEQGDGGTLIMEVAGREAGQFDVLKVTGSATLAGTLVVKLIDGFVPRNGEALRMLEIDGAVAGQFAELRVEGLPDGQTLRVDPVGGQVSIGATAAAALPPNICGAGACGAGIAPLWMTVCALCMLRPAFRRLRGRGQK